MLKLIVFHDLSIGKRDIRKVFFTICLLGCVCPEICTLLGSL